MDGIGFYRTQKHFGGHTFYDFQQLSVVQCPECNDLIGIYILVITTGIPMVLLIKNFGGIFKLAPHKTLVVIGCTIDQMTNYLLFAPLFGVRFVGKI